MHLDWTLVWWVLFYLWVALEVVIAIATRTRRGQGSVRDRGTQLLLWLSIVPAVTACLWMRHNPRGLILGAPHWLDVLAVAVLFIALLIRVSAVAMLGKAFSANVAILDSQQLNTSGLYGWVRHPSYLGLILVFLAIALQSRHWLGLAIMAVPAAALIYRIHIEELALRDAFGSRVHRVFQAHQATLPRHLLTSLQPGEPCLLTSVPSPQRPPAIALTELASQVARVAAWTRPFASAASFTGRASGLIVLTMVNLIV